MQFGSTCLVTHLKRPKATIETHVRPWLTILFETSWLVAAPNKIYWAAWLNHATSKLLRLQQWLAQTHPHMAGSNRTE
jgi:hypothetical protein